MLKMRGGTSQPNSGQTYFKYNPNLYSWVTHFPLLDLTFQNYKMREFKHNCSQI